MTSYDEHAAAVTDLIAQRRAAVAEKAVQDLKASSTDDLPAVLHRLAGKLGVFGFPEAGDAARDLMRALPDLQPSEVPGRIAAIVAALGTAPATAP